MHHIKNMGSIFLTKNQTYILSTSHFTFPIEVYAPHLLFTACACVQHWQPVKTKYLPPKL